MPQLTNPAKRKGVRKKASSDQEDHSGSKNKTESQNQTGSSSNNSPDQRTSENIVNSMNCRLPGDIMLCILCRLRVKKLMQLKCVSKAWRDLMTDPGFIDLQLNHFSNDRRSQLYLFAIRDREFTNLYTISYESNITTRIAFPIRGDYEIAGCCRGVLCLSLTSPGIPVGIYFMLYNPAIKEFYEFKYGDGSKPISKGKESEFTSVGFGYDQVSNNFKIVRVERFKSETGEYGTEVDVYQCSTKNWRRIPGINSGAKFVEITPAPAVNNRLHWIGSRDNGAKIIISFDLKTEQFGELNLPRGPEERPGSEKARVYIDEWKEHLGAVYLYSKEKRFEVWMMNEHGDENSWIKDLVVGPNPGLYILGKGRKFGDFMFYNAEEKRIYMYNVETEKYKIPDFLESGSRDDEVLIYQESLVPVLDVGNKVPVMDPWTVMFQGFPIYGVIAVASFVGYSCGWLMKDLLCWVFLGLYLYLQVIGSST